MNKQLLMTTLLVLLLAAAAVYGWRWLSGGGDSPAELAERALTASTADAQEQAVAMLAQVGQPATPYLRDVLSESQTPQVRAICLQALGGRHDYESMPQILAALEDESPLVRGRASVAASRLLGRNYGWRADMPAENRAYLIARMQQEWDELRDSQLLQEFQSTIQDGK